MRTPAWWRQLRKRPDVAMLPDAPSLREFVYLDEISVYSLLASQRGAVTAELTEHEEASSSAEVGSSLGVSAGALKGGLSSRTEQAQTAGTQVHRKAIIQASFKELFESQQDRMALRVRDLGEPPAQVAEATDAVTLLDKQAEAGAWVVDVARLSRGDLLELRVELEAETIFQMSATLASLLDMFKDSPELLDVNDRPGLLQGAMVSRVLEALLAGLVPLRGRAVDYQYVSVGDRSWLVHERLLSMLTNRSEMVVRPVYMVGVAERQLFWKDIRRLLFSRARYTVLCRLARDGAYDTWTPVKLVDVVRDIAPDVAQMIDGMQRGLLKSIGEQGSSTKAIERHALEAAFVAYGEGLAEHYESEIDQEGLAAQAHHVAQQHEPNESIQRRRSAFAAIGEYLSEHHEIPTEDRELAASLRIASLEAAGLGPDGPAPSSSQDKDEESDGVSGRYLDCEPIAIYW